MSTRNVRKERLLRARPVGVQGIKILQDCSSAMSVKAKVRSESDAYYVKRRHPRTDEIVEA